MPAEVDGCTLAKRTLEGVVLSVSVMIKLRPWGGIWKLLWPL